MTLIDNLILLGAAAVVTGLLVPVITARVSARRVAQQRVAEEDLARDSKFIEAQTEFLDGVSTELWRFAGKLLAVSYYRTEGSAEQFVDAWRRYDDSAFDELFGLRALVSRGQLLVSDEAKQQLSDLHVWLFGDIDPHLTSAARSSPKELDQQAAQSWRQTHVRTMSEVFVRIDGVLATIARDVGVTARRRQGH